MGKKGEKGKNIKVKGKDKKSRKELGKKRKGEEGEKKENCKGEKTERKVRI